MEQAETGQKLVPFAPRAIDTWPADMSGIIIGMRNGLTRLGPRSIRTRACCSSVLMPPMPEPMITPTRSAFSGVIASAACSTASNAATTANWITRSIRRASWWLMRLPGSKPLTSQAKCVLSPIPGASKCVM